MARLAYHFKRRQIKLFLEELLPPNTLAAPVAAASPRSPGRVLLLFFKLYVPEAKELEQLCRYAGMLKVNNTWRPRDIVSQLNQMVGFSPDERVTLYKERDGDPEHSCAAFNMEYSFSNFRLHNGSIIWFQKTSSFQHRSLYRNATVPFFFRSLYNREEVYFVPIGKINKRPKMLLLSKEHTFTEVLFKLAKKLKRADPSKIWLTAKTRSGPAQHPIEFRPLLLIADLLTGPNKHGNGIFYYEKRGRSIPEWPGLCPLLDVAFCYADKLNEVKNYQISLPKYSRIAELTREIMTQIFKASDYILNIVDVQDTKLCAHELSADERELGVHFHVIRVFHYRILTTGNQEEVESFDPFLLVVKDGEALRNLKIRIQLKLQVSNEEFSKLRFRYIGEHSQDSQYLEDTTIVWDVFQPNRRCDDHYMALEHLSFDPSSSSKKSNGCYWLGFCTI